MAAFSRSLFRAQWSIQTFCSCVVKETDLCSAEPSCKNDGLTTVILHATSTRCSLDYVLDTIFFVLSWVFLCRETSSLQHC